MAWSRIDSDLIWSHNDSGNDPVLVGLTSQGQLVREVALAGAQNRDWEDMAAGPCGTATCLYVADTGDNQEIRKELVLYRLQEAGLVSDPGPSGTSSPNRLPAEPGVPTGDLLPDLPPARFQVPAEAFPMVLPDGPRDVEALFVLPDESVYLITKGRRHPITVYRYPPPLRPDQTVELQLVQTLSGGSVGVPDHVTGADASLDGNLVVVRTYESLTFYSVEVSTPSDLLRPLDGGRVDLGTLRERQGEAVGLGPSGKVVLTSEAGFLGQGGVLTVLECGTLPLDSTVSGHAPEGLTPPVPGS